MKLTIEQEKYAIYTYSCSLTEMLDHQNA